eukprot:UN0631
MHGNFEQVMLQQVLPRIERSVDFKSYTWNDYAVHILGDEERELLFVCMADLRMKRRIPFAFLDALRENFGGCYLPDQVQSAIAYGMDKDFKPVLQQLMERYNSPEADRLTMMQQRVADINDELMDGIGKLLERGEKIDLLVERSQALQSRSSSFMRDAGRLRRNIWWKNVRLVAALVCVVIVVIFVIVMASCGITFQHC